MALFELLLALATAVFCGASDYFAALTSRKHSNQESLLAFCLFSLPVVVAAFILAPASLSALANQLLPLLFVSFAYWAGYVLFFRALEKGKLTIVTPVSATWPAVSVLLALVWFKEPFSLILLIGGALATGGTVLAISNPLKTNSKQIAQGASEAIGAAICWGISMACWKPIVYSAGPVLPALFVAVFMTLASYALVRSSPTRLAGTLDLTAALAGVLIALAWLASNYALLALPISLFAPIAGTYPLLTMAAGYFALGERISGRQLVGAAAAVIGVVILAL